MRNIIIVEPGSTGYNFVEDIVRRGYNPVVLEAWKDVPPEILALFKDEIEKTRADILAAMYHKPLRLPSNPTVHLPAMTRKDGMHEALKAAGLRYTFGEGILKQTYCIAEELMKKK
ncbi:MAG: hypothetical protein IJU00_11950 [Selenomonas sp.]|nr:hypothetical protein [Selenomonas sp.]